MSGGARRALSSLTTRGRCLVGGGGALLLVGVLIGERAFVQLAVFVLALPLLSAAAVARERFRLTRPAHGHPRTAPPRATRRRCSSRSPTRTPGPAACGG